jgi:hypothetical protein
VQRGGTGKFCFQCGELEDANHIILAKLQMGELIKMQETDEMSWGKNVQE